MTPHPRCSTNDSRPLAGALLCVVSVSLAAGSHSPAHAADRIILRSLQIVSDRTVVSYDLEGVVLDNQTRLGWHDIERATVGKDRQEAFDRQLKELGSPLYRIRQRLTTADYAGAKEPAEALFPRYATGRGETAYLVQQATMWGRIATGERERALVAYLQCWETLRGKPALAATLPGDRRLKVDRETGLTPELAPIWFDADTARQELPAVLRQITQMSKPRPIGVNLYYAGLALAAGDTTSAERAMKAVTTPTPVVERLLTILAAEREIRTNQPGIGVAQLESAAPNLPAEWRPLAGYWLGVSKLTSSDESIRQAGMLQLLRIPALSGQEQPELAGAALFQVMRTLEAHGDATGSVAVRRELLERYGQTYHAVRVRGSTETEKKP